MKYTCDMITDMMLLCIAETASPETRAAVHAHAAGCKTCQEKWKKMTGSKRIPAQSNESRNTLSKKKIIRSAGFLLAVILIVLSHYVLIPFAKKLYHCGSTPEAAISKGPATDDPVFYRYDYNNMTLLGTEQDGSTLYYWMMDDNDCVRFKIVPYCGLYYCESANYEFIVDPDTAVNMPQMTDIYKTPDKKAFLPVCVTNPKIKEIRFREGTVTVTGKPDENGFCLLKYDSEIPYQTAVLGTTYYCKAFDEEGNILYTWHDE